MSENKAIFETMSVPKALAKLAVPTIISQLISMIYNMADTFFIGRTNDPYKVAAVSLSFILFFLMNALANLFGVGGGSLISRLLGEKKDNDAKKVCAFSFYGTIVVAAMYCAVCCIFMEPLLKFLGASSNTMLFAKQYTLWVVVVGGIPSTLSLTMAHLLRSEGYSKQAGFGLSMGGVVNIFLDPLFMFLLMPEGMEVAGAAIATLSSNVISLIYYGAVFIRIRKKSVLSLSVKNVNLPLKYVGQILSVGLPSALGTVLACATNMLINHLAAYYGDIPIAAFGIVKKMEMLPMNTGMGLCQGMMPLVAYNYASGDYGRMKKTINCARIAGMGFAVLCIVAFEIFAKTIVGVFIDDGETIRIGTNFMRICCLATPLMISNFQMTYTFQAMGKGRESLLLSACRQGIINIPLLFLMEHLFGMYGIMWTQLVSDGLTFIVAMTMYTIVLRRLPNRAEMK